MIPLPRNRREIRPWLKKLTQSGKRFASHRRGTVIATACVLVFGVAMSAWALSGSDAGRKDGRKVVPYSASKPVVKGVERTSMTRKASVATKDPLAAGRRLLDAKKYDEAIDAFQPLVSDHVEARFWLGLAHLGSNNDFRGCRQLEKYLELAPKGRYVTTAKATTKKRC